MGSAVFCTPQHLCRCLTFLLLHEILWLSRGAEQKNGWKQSGLFSKWRQGTKVHSIQMNNMSLPSIRREGAYRVKNTYWQVGELGNKNIHFSAVLGLVYPCTRYEPWSSRLLGGLLMSYYSSWPVGIIASYKRNVQQVIPVSMWVGTVKAAGLEKMHNS